MGDDGEKPKADVPFEPIRSAVWAQVVNGWPWRHRDGETSSKVGSCPRCGHQMSVVTQSVFHLRFETAPEAMKVYAACNCGAKHEDAPEGQSGCGANGLIDGA